MDGGPLSFSSLLFLTFASDDTHIFTLTRPKPLSLLTEPMDLYYSNFHSQPQK
jgi:hypothetical protein